MSKTRRIYFLRLVGRVIMLLVVFGACFLKTEWFEAVEKMNFFDKLSPIHILWGIWMLDMFLQLVPVKAHISIGSRKNFRAFFRPIKEKIDAGELGKYIKNTTLAAYKVMIIWLILTVVISVLYIQGFINKEIMILISTFFYVCDLICVLIWCPFRLIMKNKCCTTCRIFNWDHLMMFLPIIALNSFYSWSLVIFSFVVWLIWEICVFVYPERFWENSNMNLKCSECTDKLCTQYCRKLKKVSTKA